MRVPFFTKSERAAPLQRCIDHAAGEMGMSEYVVATTMSHFLEKVSEEVSRGRVVRLPGFGVFGPKMSRGMHGCKPRYYPAFSAARCWRNLIVMFCKPTAADLEAVHRHQHNHVPSSGSTHVSSRPLTAHRGFRRQLLGQARKIGLEAGLPAE